MSEQPDQIPCFSAEGARAKDISLALAASLVRDGRGCITRSRTGRQRFVAFAYEPTGHDLRAGSRTTCPARADGSLARGNGQLLGDQRATREHLRNDVGWRKQRVIEAQAQDHGGGFCRYPLFGAQGFAQTERRRREGLVRKEGT